MSLIKSLKYSSQEHDYLQTTPIGETAPLMTQFLQIPT